MNTPYPTLNFGLGEEIDMLRDTVYQFCQKELAPRANDIDRDNAFPMDLWQKFGDHFEFKDRLEYFWTYR